MAHVARLIPHAEDPPGRLGGKRPRKGAHVQLKEGSIFAALLLAVAFGLAGSGCGYDSRLAEQREALELEQAARMQALGSLEIRLIAIAAASRQWEELGDRHRDVSEIACQNAGEHLAAMERHQARQNERARQVRAVSEESTEIVEGIKLSSATRRKPVISEN